MSKSVKIPGGTMTWLMDDTIQSGAAFSLAEMTVSPGEMSELHRHNNCDETIFLRAGTINQRIGDKWLAMNPGDHCVIPRHTVHQTRNTGTGTAEMLLVYSEGIRHYEKISH